MATRQMAPSGPPSDEKMIGLEALRFAAALAILIYHYPQFVPNFMIDHESAILVAPFQVIFAPLYAYGWAAVQLFWCISGFIFAWKYSGPIGAGKVSFRGFAILRFSRLYPLHFATLLAVAALQIIYLRTHGAYFIYEYNDLKHFALNIFFASSWGLQDGTSFNGPSWSISLELLVYALFFACCRLIGSRTWLAMPVAFGLFFLSAEALSVDFLGIDGFQAVAFFYLGVLTCQIYEKISTRSRAARIMIGGAAGLVSLVGLMHLENGAPNPLVFPGMVLMFLLFIPDRDKRANRVLCGLGDLTYASYMLHFPVQLAFLLLLNLAGIDMKALAGSGAFLLVYLIAVLALSRVVFITFERPAQHALRSLLLARTVVAGQAVAVSGQAS